MFDYEKYGDSPTCLNEDCEIAGKESILQGFGKTETGDFPNKLLETTVNTITNRECKIANRNAGDQIPQLPYGINRTILCTMGIEHEGGEYSVRI